MSKKGNKKRFEKSRRDRTHAGVAIGLIVLSVGLYLNTIGHGFLFDDVTLILQNPQVLNLDWGSILSYSGYRPLRTLTYALNFLAGGTDPFGYHLVNVILHALTVLLVYVFVTKLARNKVISGVAALLFAVHPVQTAAVAYVSGRKDLLAAFFLLSGFLIFTLFRKDPKPNWVRGSAAFVCFAFAILSKEVAIVFPLLLICLDAVLESQQAREQEDADLSVIGAASRALRKNPYLYGAFAALAAGALYWAVFINSASRMEGYWGGSFASNLGTSLKLFAHYVRLAIYPHPLIADYQGRVLPVSESLIDLGTGLALVVAVGFLAGILYSFKKDPLIGFGMAWFVLALLPVLQLIPFHELAADHFLYVPLVGFAISVSCGFSKLLDSGRSRVAWGGLILVIAVLSVRVVDRNNDWKDAKSLWTATLRDAPDSYRANANLAQIYFQEGRIDEAIRLTEHAIELKPGEALPRGNLGGMYYRMAQGQRQVGNFENAKVLQKKSQESLEAALAIEPRDPFILSNLGNVYKDLALIYEEEGDIQRASESRLKARELYLKALRTRDPRPAVKAIWLNYGGLLVDGGFYSDVPEALSNYVSAYPADPRGFYWIGFSYYQTGDYALAAENLEVSASLEDNPDTLSLLGSSYQALGAGDKALESYSKALQLNPNSAEVHYNLGLLYSQSGKFQESIQHLEQASRNDRSGEFRARITDLLGLIVSQTRTLEKE